MRRARARTSAGPRRCHGLVLARRVRGPATALVAIAVQSVGLLVPTKWLVLAWGCAWFLVGGIAHGLKNVLLRTLIHERVPPELHGRPFAAYNGLRNFAEEADPGGAAAGRRRSRVSTVL